MQQRTRLIVNSVVNVVQRLLALAARFIILPFALGVMGRPQYGLWVVVGQVFAYTPILDMGLRSAIQREVAKGLASGAHDEVDRYVNTGAVYYAAAGGILLLLSIGLAIVYPMWFDVEPQYVGYARLMVLVAGLGLAATLPQNAYTGVLSGLQRYDLICASHVLEDVIRLALVFLVLKPAGLGFGLVVLALAFSGSRFIGACARTWFSFRLCPVIHLAPWRAQRGLLGGMMLFGINSVVFVMALPVAVQAAQILIGGMLDTAQATDFNIAVNLMAAGHAFVLAFGIATRVVASRYEGERNQGKLKLLLLRSARYGSFATLAGVALIVAYADVIIRLWVGNEYTGVDGEATITRIVLSTRVLAIAYTLFWLALPGFNVVNGMGRHHVPGVLAMIVGVTGMLSAGLTLVVMDKPPIDVVAWAIVLPTLPVWAVILPWYCCRVVGQSLRQYTLEGFVVPALACIPAAVAAVVGSAYYAPASWGSLGGQVIGLVVLLAPCGWFLVLARDDRAHLSAMLGGVLNRLRRARRPS